MARGRDRLGAEVLADDRHRLASGEGRLSADHLVEHHSERVEVRPRAGGAPQGLLGREVGDRADHPSPAPRPGGGEAEVAEPGAAIGVEPDVRRLQVAVDDPAGVGVLERPADVDPDAERPLHLQACPRAQPRAGP